MTIELEQSAASLQDLSTSIECLQAEGVTLRPQVQRGKLVFRDEAHKTAYAENQDLLRLADVEERECKEKHNDLLSSIRAAKRKIKSTMKKKEHGAMSQVVRQRIEQMLEDLYKIIRSAYHGGDFEGNHCRKWMRLARSVMDSIELVLLNVPAENRAAGCDDNEIRKCCQAYKRLFQHFDLLIHYTQQPFGTLTDTDMDNVRKLVGMLDRLWRRLLTTVRPKAHAWHHLVQDLERFRGLKHNQESKIATP